MLAIQIVTVTWTKASRGGATAADRNQIPRAFELRLHEGSPNVIQRHVFKEFSAGKFESRPVTFGQAPSLPAHVEGLLLEKTADNLVVGFSWIRNIHGMPDRGHKRRVASLVDGESAQIRVNGRHSAGAQWYTQHTFNVAYGSDIREGVFLGGAIAHVISLEENLF
jgi:hypothetical protein